MHFRPLHDRVLVRRIEAEEKTAGGIIIPDTAKEKPTEGEVVAVGPGARDETGKLVELDVKAGDHILFGKWSGERHPGHYRAHRRAQESGVIEKARSSVQPKEEKGAGQNGCKGSKICVGRA